MHSVGLDEAHEMCVNKEGKSSFVKQTKDDFGRLVHFFPYRSKANKNLKEQLRLNPQTTAGKVQQRPK